MNTRRENRLEELGRVDAERARTRKGKRNLREEKDRIRSELKSGGRATTRPMTPDQKRKPKKANWGYTIVGGNALYDPTPSEDFQLHPSEEQSLVTKILALAGINLNKPGLVQVAEQQNIQKIQQQKS